MELAEIAVIVIIAATAATAEILAVIAAAALQLKQILCISVDHVHMTPFGATRITDLVRIAMVIVIAITAARGAVEVLVNGLK